LASLWVVLWGVGPVWDSRPISADKVRPLIHHSLLGSACEGRFSIPVQGCVLDRSMSALPQVSVTRLRYSHAEISVQNNHSHRSAYIGSTAAARVAGNRQANAATASSRKEGAKRMRGLIKVLSTHCAMRRFSAKLNPRPAMMPKPTLIPADVKTILST
jgi:hypothetical protein